MIDTIHIRLHNLGNYPHLLDHLLRYSKKLTTNAVGSLPKNENSQYFFLKMEQFEQYGNMLYNFQGEKITSSHYTMAFRMPMGGRAGTVDFNFSIPKLLYGTNIIQFVRHKTEPWSIDSGCCMEDYKWNQENTWDRLMEFIDQFFKKYFYPSEKIDFNDIEIMRIDICFNQYFNSKKDALDCLSHQQKIKKKHLRIMSKNRYSFATAVFYKTKDYACKIYHKGSEYRSTEGEEKKHKKWNRDIQRDGFKGRKTLYDTKKLGEHADRILRYEISFHHSYLSKLYLNHVWRRKNKYWQHDRKLLKEIDRIYNGAVHRKDVSKEARIFWLSVYNGRVDNTDSITQKCIYKYAPDFKLVDLRLGLSAKDRKLFDWWNHQKDCYVSFRLRVSKRDSNMNTGFVDGVPLKKQGSRNGEYDIDCNKKKKVVFEALFSKYLLKRCFKVFNDFRDYFEIKERTDLTDAMRKLDLYRENIATINKATKDLGIGPKPRYKGVLAAINQLQYESLDSLVEKGCIHRSTAWRWEKKFKELNFNLHTGSAYQIWNDRTFETYHRELFFDGLNKYLDNNIFF